MRRAIIPTSATRTDSICSIGVNGVGLGAARSFAAGHDPALREAQQPDGAERRLQRLTAGNDSGTGGGADVLGLARTQSRGAGARADQGARRDARRRLSRRPGASSRWSRGWPRSRSISACFRARSAAPCRSPKATSAVRSRRSSERSSRRTRRSIATCAVTRAAMTADARSRGMERFQSARLRQLPQRTDVLRLHATRAWRARQPEARRVRIPA